MPIVGLRGYMIGRTDAMLSSKEEINIPNNIQVQYYPGRKSTKIATRRQFKISSQLLYNPLSIPVWLLEAQREASLFKFSQKEATEHTFDYRDSHDISPVGLIALDQAGWRYRHRFYARTSAPFSNPTTSQAGDMSNDANSRVKEADGSLHSGLKGSFSAAAVELDSPSHVPSSLQENKHGASVESRHRSSRRPRNRIREKAEKEAEARARRVQKPVTQVKASEVTPNSWNPLLRMCRSLLLLKTLDTKKSLIPRIDERPSGNNIAAA